VERILKRYPQLGAAKIFDALAFALDNPEVIEADIRREEEILTRAGHPPPARPTNTSQMELPFLGETAEAPSSDKRRK
jgi:hypothetical protein